VTLTDTHAHLQESEFSADIEAVVERARTASVDQIIVPAVDLETARTSLQLSEHFEGLWATAGFHPHEASRLDEASLLEIERLLEEPRVVAVGEIGLDYNRLHSTREVQLACMEKMLDLAERHTMPVIVHCRDAWEDTAALLSTWSHRVRPSFSDKPLGVMHYFSGTPDQATYFIGLDFLISMHTSVTHPKQAQMRDVAASVPLAHLVIETDSPYGAPQGHRGKRNEPAFVLEACREIARARGIGEDEVAAATTANAKRLFRLPVVASKDAYTRTAR
jgi:TatD DNase family protein